jgi:hydrogenase maturation protease HycI
MFGHLAAHLQGKVVIVGIGSALQSDDAAGSLVAQEISGQVPWIVYDASSSPENYLGKIIRDRPDSIILIDAVEFGATAGQMTLLEGGQVKGNNLFSTHNASLALTVDYLRSNLKSEVLIVGIQPKRVCFGEIVSDEVNAAVRALSSWLVEHGKNPR